MSQTSTPVLPGALTLGAVHLTVADLDRSVAFYERALGLRVHRRDATTAAMGAGGGDLVALVEDPAATPAGRHAGLFHFALLSSSREELARAVTRLAATGTAITGASDHGVSEAIYLRDPDGNGIELYADRPRSQWPAPGPGERVGMFTIALDVDGLLALVAGEEPRPHAGPGLAMGHVHLHVGDLERGLGFYRDGLGFELMVMLGGGAAFVAAGGYHHHLGFNVWLGEGIGPAPEHTAGLRRWEIVLPGAADVDALRGRVTAAAIDTADAGDGAFAVRDPWGIEARVSAAAPAAAHV